SPGRESSFPTASERRSAGPRVGKPPFARLAVVWCFAQGLRAGQRIEHGKVQGRPAATRAVPAGRTFESPRWCYFPLLWRSPENLWQRTARQSAIRWFHPHSFLVMLHLHLVINP